MRCYCCGNYIDPIQKGFQGYFVEGIPICDKFCIILFEYIFKGHIGAGIIFWLKIFEVYSTYNESDKAKDFLYATGAGFISFDQFSHDLFLILFKTNG